MSSVMDNGTSNHEPDEDTLGASTLHVTTGVRQLSRARVPILTILFHPDLDRIGQRSWLNDPGGDGTVRISRGFPAFGASHQPERTPLRDKYLSRTPHRLEVHRNGDVSIHRADGGSALEIDGETAHPTQRFSSERVEAGLVLSLGDRVVLLLHKESPVVEPSNDNWGLVGTSQAIQLVREQIVRVADFDVPVLIRGESGTGKELVAEAIHRASRRCRARFVCVNMAALVPTTAAAALFGHTQGAFTGATQASEGFFGAADTGTLFLDEIGETPHSVQPTLLRALESGEVQPLGAGGAQMRNVRVITATDSDLERAVEGGRFRLPLLQRLAGYEITLPPLRDRKQDVALLMVHFLKELLRERDATHLLAPRRHPWLPASLVVAATLARWPGNVRQLRNFVRRVVIDCADLARVDPSRYASWWMEDGEVEIAAEPTEPRVRSTRRSLSNITEEMLFEALRRHDFKPGSAAKDLGVSRYSIYALIESSSRVRKAGDLGATEIEEQLARSGGELAAAARLLEVSVRGLQLRMTQLSLA